MTDFHGALFVQDTGLINPLTKGLTFRSNRIALYRLLIEKLTDLLAMYRSSVQRQVDASSTIQILSPPWCSVNSSVFLKDGPSTMVQR